MNSRKIHLVLLLGAVVLYLTSLVLPIVKGTDWIGLACLLIGWMSLLSVYPDAIFGFFAWFSNIPFLIGMLLSIIYSIRFLNSPDTKLSKAGQWIMNVSTRIIPFVAFVLCLAAFGFNETYKNEGGTKMDVQYLVGMYIWVGSYTLYVISSFFSKKGRI